MTVEGRIEDLTNDLYLIATNTGRIADALEELLAMEKQDRQPDPAKDTFGSGVWGDNQKEEP